MRTRLNWTVVMWKKNLENRRRGRNRYRNPCNRQTQWNHPKTKKVSKMKIENSLVSAGTPRKAGTPIKAGTPRKAGTPSKAGTMRKAGVTQPGPYPLYAGKSLVIECRASSIQDKLPFHSVLPPLALYRVNHYRHSIKTVWLPLIYAPWILFSGVEATDRNAQAASQTFSFSRELQY